MTVKELITALLDCPMDAKVIIQKELNFNLWVNSDVSIASADRDVVALDFNFPTDELEVRRKSYS